MFYQIDELLKNSEYDIYNNSEVSDEKVIEPYLNKYLAQAYDEDDEMWISNIIYFRQLIMH